MASQEEQNLIEFPKHFPPPLYHNSEIPFNSKIMELGEELFFDPILSIDSTISCGSCHHKEFAFSNSPFPFSQGIDQQLGRRNTPTLSNLAWYPYFMADGGVNHLEVFPIAPITDTLEMGNNLKDLIAKLNNSEYYSLKFKEAFSSDSINTKQLFIALAQYQISLISANSKYDQFQLGETTLNQEELEGLALFNEACASCHTPPLFTDFSFSNNHLTTSKDIGRALITQSQEDTGKFKIPSLRNISLTGPYFHNGSIETLEEVIAQYSAKEFPNNSDPRLFNIRKFTKEEQAKLLSFLNTLTDYSFIEE